MIYAHKLILNFELQGFFLILSIEKYVFCLSHILCSDLIKFLKYNEIQTKDSG